MESNQCVSPRAGRPGRPGRPGTAATVAYLAAAVAAAAAAALVMIFSGWSVQPPVERHPPRGVDVSEHQGRIDWGKVRMDGYTFAFIKATEGRDHVDSFFAENWRSAARAGLNRGAYHFYLFRRGGMEQAENFISVVPADLSSLPPVVDVELGGSNGNDPDVEAVRSELAVFIGEMEKRYGSPPIIYTNQVTYVKLIMGHFPRCSIWIAGPDGAPGLPDGREWTFWQYTFTGSVDGISGPVDLNVYNTGEETLTDTVLAEQAAL